MKVLEFLEVLPTIFDNWGTTAMRPKDTKWLSIASQFDSQPGTANFLQLVSAACDYLEAGEVFCEIGCLAGANLVAALKDRPDRLAYGIDFYATVETTIDRNIEQLQSNLDRYNILDRVCFSHQTTDDFFKDLQAIHSEDKFGVYVYNFQPDYREVLMSLTLARTFLAERALIIVANTDNPIIRRAVADFFTMNPTARIALDWQNATKKSSGAREWEL